VRVNFNELSLDGVGVAAAIPWTALKPYLEPSLK
jgi:hypothetical protein